jgi:large subunit ribosomal protein L35
MIGKSSYERAYARFLCLPVDGCIDEEKIMPKQKTHKGTAKRFRLTKNNKVMRMKAGRSHLRRKKRSSLNSDFRHAVSSSEKSTVKLVIAVAGSAAR